MINKLKAIVKTSRAVVGRSPFPLKLTVGLTYQCQSKCNHCDIWKIYQRNPERYKDEAQCSIYLKLLEDLKDNVLWLEFTGGEPFLRKEIVEIVSFALNNTGIVAAGITSNGLDHDLVLKNVREILTKSKKKQLVIGISIDGDPETYECVRGLNGFDSAMRTFLDLKRIASSFKNMRPHIAYTISHFNAGSFPDFYGFISEEYGINIAEISFAVEHPFGYYFQDQSENNREMIHKFEKQILYDIQFIRSLMHNSKLNYTNPLNLFYDYYLENVSTYFKNPMQQVIPCKACELSAYIDPYGYVYPCTMWNKVLGSLKKRSFISIWESAKRQATMQAVRAERCPNCWTPCEAQPSWLFNLGLIRGLW
jgi:MoaA/NifB/PqqE/SkfB family radical SAM enzyme